MGIGDRHDFIHDAILNLERSESRKKSDTCDTNLVCTGPKALAKFHKLVMKRIKWTGGDDDDMEDDDDEMQVLVLMSCGKVLLILKFLFAPMEAPGLGLS